MDGLKQEFRDRVTVYDEGHSDGFMIHEMVQGQISGRFKVKKATLLIIVDQTRTDCGETTREVWKLRRQTLESSSYEIKFHVGEDCLQFDKLTVM